MAVNRFWRLVFVAATVWVLGGVPSAHAQVMKPNGMALPGFLFPAAERRAREACLQQRPECRASVRAQIEQEMAYSLLIPWVLLGGAILGVLLWMRGKEKQKERARLVARAHHEPGKFRKLDHDSDERPKQTDNDDELT
jgi:hypothetical protein